MKFKMEKIFILMFYFFIMAMFLCFNSIFFYWILVEFNLIAFILIMFMIDKQINYGKELEHIYFYFLVQCLGSFMIIFSSFMCSFSMEMINSLIFISGIIIKMGIFPSYKWVIKISKFMDPFSFSLLLSFQKFPLFVGMFFIELNLMVLFLFLNMIFGCIMMLFNSMNIYNLLIFSSIYNSIWFLFIYETSELMFLLFLLQYNFYLFSILYFNLTSMKMDLNMFFMSAFLMGIPPFSFFFFKFFCVSFLYEITKEMIFFLWPCLFLALISYFNFFLITTLKMEKIYFKFQDYLISTMIFIWSSITFISIF